MSNSIKNIGILAHVDAGKTILTEQLLFQTGAIRKLGRVDHGNTQTDSMALERERGITIKSVSTSYNYKGQKINIVDTPGHVDFVAEVERALLLLDGAILVISAREGVQSHTRLLFNALKRMKVPTLIFVNKIDRLGVDTGQVVEQIRTQLTPAVWVMQTVEHEGSREAQPHPLPLHPSDELIELLATVDEQLLLDYLEGDKISEERLHEASRVAVGEQVTIPLLFGSALHSIGLPALLDKIHDLLPEFKPLAHDEISGIVSQVFRQNIKTGRVSVIKLTSGELKYRGFVGEDRITHLNRWEHGQLKPVETLRAGDIGMIMGLNHLNVGDTFGPIGEHKGFILGKPTLKVKVLVDRPTQRKELLTALTLMAESDPYLSYELSEFNDDVYINLFGQVQMEIVQETLRRDYGVDITMDDPMTIYLETPLGPGEANFPMYHDGIPFHAGLGFRIEPLPRGSGIQYVAALKSGGPRQMYLNGIEDGVYAYLDQGLHGWELTDMKISLIDYQYNSITTTPSEYRDLAPLVLFEAIKQAGTKQLWPICEYQLTVPTALIGRAMSDLRQMKASMEEPVIEGENCLITGLVPFESCRNYEAAVQEYSGGLGHFESKVTDYEDAPEEMYQERPRFKADPANIDEFLMGRRRKS